MGVIIIESLEDFQAELKKAGDKLVVVDFTATWCGPCKMIGPEFHNQSTLPENANVVFLQVDVDDADEVSSFCKIGCMPTFHYYKNGSKVDEFSGANKDSMIQKLKALRT
ncbi:thioredoxin-like [Pseudochaenichthys georgianus]|uniref:Thioredoxin n=3 Tax=Channichthyidae TaxID=30806 RepID=A0AAN8GWT7_CHAGU|nr:thioredoxin [Pseudochaenichthys georgianus]KAI4808645.1 hypothetical protein KUCAC02_000694 [Chaenocephalus aceratus]KAK5875755.1 hypothetical protein CesoFtcFv8_026800 [Champsocephalus esox]KAK5893422.1 hypothetical protein CgunFtcFv8_006295 [Champsocephalus gunnari]